MSELQGAYFSVSMKLRTAEVIPLPNTNRQEVLIHQPSATIFSIDDFVFQADADKLGQIWIKSLTETTPSFFQDTSGDETPENRVMQAAAMAAAKIDRALLTRRVEAMDMPIPSRFCLTLPPDNGFRRHEILETLVPFNRIREILIQREQNPEMPPIGHIAFEAQQHHAVPKHQMN